MLAGVWDSWLDGKMSVQVSIPFCGGPLVCNDWSVTSYSLDNLTINIPVFGDWITIANE